MEHKSHKGHGDHAAHIEEFKKRFLVCLILTIPVTLLSPMIQSWSGYSLKIPYQEAILVILSSIIYFYGGSPFLKGSADEVKKHQPGMMTLIAMAISVAFFYSLFAVILNFGMDFFWELATLIDVMLIGHWIEAKSLVGASRAVEELVKIMPTTAHLVKDDKVIDIPVSKLEINDKVQVKPGEKIPSDGIVIDGESFVNEAMLTGESKPVHKKTNDQVTGGSINNEGILTVKTEKTGESTYLSQVIKLVKQAQESRSRTQDLANRAAAILFYIAVSVGILTYLIWYFLGKPSFGIERSVTVLVISCPHALGLAIPLVVALSTTITARNGILIRDRKAFEVAKDINAIVFDKTGTLTEGRFGVTDVISYIDNLELLRLTAGIETNSEHITAKSITDFVHSKGVDIPKVTDFKAIPGKGVYGKIENKEIYVASPGYLKELNIDINDKQVENLQNEGKTVVFTVINNKLAGAFVLSDTIKKESYEAIRKLKEMGIKTYMITGDAEQAASFVTKELGIDHYYAQVLPNQKVDRIKEIQKQGYKVAMVGDGINDAPALAASDTGIAIGAGTDIAIESADIILVKSNPLDVINVIFLSKITYAKMIQNLWWAAGYNIIAIPLAAGVLYNYGIVISPAIGALLMSLSTIIVAINSQTLRKFLTEYSVLKFKRSSC